MKAILLGDMHVGSNVGLCFPDETPPNDPSRVTRDSLYGLWKAAAEKEGRPDVLIVNGDAVEGPNRKGSGIGVWTTDVMQQADQAAELIQMWKAKRVFVIRGSNYHVQEGTIAVEEYVARKAGAEEYPGQEDVPKNRRQRSGWHWYIGLGDVTLHASHRVGISRVFHYRTTPLSRELLHSRLNDLLRHEVAARRVRLVVRSHAHYYLWVEHSGSEGVILPCWKALDDWMLERGSLDISPDIGYVTLKIEGGKLSHEKTLYPIDKIQTVPYTRVGEGGRGQSDGSANRKPARRRK